MAAHLACAFFFDADAEPVGGEPRLPARLDACALCAKALARDSDIFMYRGDTPFCSEDCRHEQMQLDAVRARPRSGGRRPAYSASAGAAESRRAHRDARKVSAVAT